MRLLTYRPTPLAAAVDLLWIYESNGGPHATERLLPDGTMELVIDLGDDADAGDGQGDVDLVALHGGALIGARSQAFTIGTLNPTTVIGAHFKPGSAFPFLPPPAGEFSGAVVSLDDVWGRDARVLRERLLANSDPTARFRLLEHFLLDRTAHPLASHPAITFSLNEFRSPNPATVGEVTAATGLS